MKKRKSRQELIEIIEKIKEKGITYKDGANLYGVKVKQLYDCRYRTQKKGYGSQQEVGTATETVKDTDTKAESLNNNGRNWGNGPN